MYMYPPAPGGAWLVYGCTSCYARQQLHRPLSQGVRYSICANGMSYLDQSTSRFESSRSFQRGPLTRYSIVSDIVPRSRTTQQSWLPAAFGLTTTHIAAHCTVGLFLIAPTPSYMPFQRRTSLRDTLQCLVKVGNDVTTVSSHPSSRTHSMCSMPTLTRIASNLVPDDALSSSLSCECVVENG
jgi:hypothetical protein